MRTIRRPMKPALLAAMISLAGCYDVTEPEPAPEPAPAPTAADEAFASDVADAMIDRIVALLFREFAVTTPENAAVGSEAISNVFHDANPTMRLVGDIDPLRDNDRP